MSKKAHRFTKVVKKKKDTRCKWCGRPLRPEVGVSVVQGCKVHKGKCAIDCKDWVSFTGFSA